MADNKKTEIFNKVSEIVADHFDVDRAKITDDLNLKTDLDADSIDFVEFVLELEDTFGEEINDEDAEKLIKSCDNALVYFYNIADIDFEEYVMK